VAVLECHTFEARVGPNWRFERGVEGTVEGDVAGGRVAVRVMRQRVKAMVEELPVVIVAWERALVRREEAVRRRDTTLAAAERELAAALGGMSLRRWQHLVNGRVSIRTAQAALEVHQALKRRAAVELVLRRLTEIGAEEEAKIKVAEQGLAAAARDLLVYGSIAEEITGRRSP
jgi:hypothetical protein